MKTLLNRISSIFAIIIAATFLLTACDSSTSSDDHDDHADDVEGLELIHDGEVYIRYLDGEVTELVHAHYHVGEEYDFTVRFLDHDGDPLHADDFDEDFSLGWVIGDEEILTIEQHEGDGRWAFHLLPLHEGETTVIFRLMHGNHSDFDTTEIEFHIDPADEDHDHDH